MEAVDYRAGMKVVPGTYSYVELDNASKRMIREFTNRHNIPSPTPSGSLHTTLLYSKKPAEGYSAQGKIDPPYEATIKSIEVWDMRNGKKCIVLKLDCPSLVERQKFLTDKYKTISDFPDYKPHVTVSYDVGGNFNDTKFDAKEEFPEPLRFTKEKQEAMRDYE